MARRLDPLLRHNVNDWGEDMQRRLLAAAAAALAMISGAAHAEAWASAQFGSQTEMVGDPLWGSTYSWDATKTLAPGDSWSVTVPYKVTISSYGLPDGGRMSPQCTSAFPMACQRAFTGYESAEAYVYWVTDGRYGQFDGIDLSISPDQDFYISSGRANYSGLMTFTATNVGYESKTITAFLAAGLFADSVPIPEPTSAVLLIAGIGFLARVRRRQTGVSGETT